MNVVNKILCYIILFSGTRLYFCCGFIGVGVDFVMFVPFILCAFHVFI